MSNQFWNERYDESGFAYGTKPNAYLTSKSKLLQPGMNALAVADGEGRNGVWLASKGLNVLSVDGSYKGLEKAKKLASDFGVSIQTDCADLITWDWPKNIFKERRRS